jgi:hypothetical protein
MLPTPRDKAIILAVYTHGHLSREQVRRLFFRKEAGKGSAALASVQATGARLRRLAKAGYLIRAARRVMQGSGQYLYTLGPMGVRLLSLEYRIQARIASVREVPSGFLPLNHTIEVADFYIALKEALELLELGDGAILTWLGEREAAFRFYHQGRKRMIAPDAYCLWSRAGKASSFFLEWERGTQGLVVLAAKLDGYDAYYTRRGYLEHLGEVGLTPRLVFVFPQERRAREFRGWLDRHINRGRWRFLPTILVGVRLRVLGEPLGKVWGKPGAGGLVSLGS